MINDAESGRTPTPKICSLDDLAFDNRFTKQLPADANPANTCRQVEHAAYSRVKPTPVPQPKTIAWSQEVADLLGFDVKLAASSDFAEVFGGNRIPIGADPFAMAYGGYQFGSWARQLGDGRAIALGEVVDANGNHQTLQLKGAGPTQYSRTADGRAVLRSSIREFLCSEAMHHLGIPTTRALSLVLTGDDVIRDMLYDGNPAPEPGAIVCRVAPSFVRFGNFELPASREDTELLRQLVEFTIRNYFPELLSTAGEVINDDVIVRWFGEVCALTADLVVDWMRVGFVHGVLNTDNMSILGLTIDYGPYGWLENFDPGWTPNTTDASMLRYRYGAQPQIAHWNLAQLGNAIAPLLVDTDSLQATLDGYRTRYLDGFTTMTIQRLGWGFKRDGDQELVDKLFNVLQLAEIDQVIFFRNLSAVPVDSSTTDDALLEPMQPAFYNEKSVVGDVRGGIIDWLRNWGRRVAVSGVGDVARIEQMNALNPKYVLRNYLAQEAIDLARDGDYSRVHELLEVLRRPYDEQPKFEKFAARRPEWARTRVGSSMLSCSS